MSDPARLLEEALALDPSERALMARRLIGSLEESESDADELWRDEIRRRVDEVEAGTASLEDWEAVRGRLRAAVGR